jgi:hypothetical protein
MIGGARRVAVANATTVATTALVCSISSLIQQNRFDPTNNKLACFVDRQLQVHLEEYFAA